MYTRRGLILAILATGLLPGQEPQPAVQVTGAVKHSITLTPDDLAKMPRASVRTRSNGMETLYDGVWLHDVLKRAGAAQGSELRGKALASYVLAEAQDGYQVVFSLAELDPSFVESGILLADTGNGKPCLEPKAGFAWWPQKISRAPAPSACSPGLRLFR